MKQSGSPGLQSLALRTNCFIFNSCHVLFPRGGTCDTSFCMRLRQIIAALQQSCSVRLTINLSVILRRGHAPGCGCRLLRALRGAPWWRSHLQFKQLALWRCAAVPVVMVTSSLSQVYIIDDEPRRQTHKNINVIYIIYIIIYILSNIMSSHSVDESSSLGVIETGMIITLPLLHCSASLISARRKLLSIKCERGDGCVPSWQINCQTPYYEPSQPPLTYFHSLGCHRAETSRLLLWPWHCSFPVREHLSVHSFFIAGNRFRLTSSNAAGTQ